MLGNRLWKLTLGVLTLLAMAGVLAASDDAPLHTYGGVAHLRLNLPLPLTAPIKTLDGINVKQFTFEIFPTGEGVEGGTVENPTGGLGPFQVTVNNGTYDHRADNPPLELDVLNSETVSIPKAPGGQIRFVYTVLYHGREAAVCTGIVQAWTLDQGKVVLTDQFSYDCRGGAGAKWVPKKHRLHVESGHFAAGDQPCCPSLVDAVDFRFDGDHVKPENVEVQ